MNDIAKSETRSNLSASVQRCFYDSGALDSQSNSLFEKEINASDQYAIDWTPVVTINNEKYSGNLLCSNPVTTATCPLFAALCASYAPETIPNACSGHIDLGSSSSCPRGERRDNCGVCGGNGRSCNFETPTVIVVFLTISGTIIVLQFAFAVHLHIQIRRRRAIRDRESQRYVHDDGSDETLHSDSSTSL